MFGKDNKGFILMMKKNGNPLLQRCFNVYLTYITSPLNKNNVQYISAVHYQNKNIIRKFENNSH